MQKLTHTFVLSILAASASFSNAAVISSVPGPDDQGGMIMPMVVIEASDSNGTNPAAGAIKITTDPSAAVPILQGLTTWSPGNWFDEAAAWRADLSPQLGTTVGMPGESAGNGDLFNNQYGFMFMGMGMPGMAFVPEGNSLAIRLTSISSPDLLGLNYSTNDNRWDPVFAEVGDQVLWDGTMWHLYFTLPADAESGEYSATFEIFMADTEFSGGTGFAQYDTAALNAQPNSNFTSDFVTLTWDVIPEPSAALLIPLALLSLVFRRRV